jgi:hypothetical protein
MPADGVQSMAPRITPSCGIEIDIYIGLWSCLAGNERGQVRINSQPQSGCRPGLAETAGRASGLKHASVQLDVMELEDRGELVLAMVIQSHADAAVEGCIVSCPQSRIAIGSAGLCPQTLTPSGTPGRSIMHVCGLASSPARRRA